MRETYNRRPDMFTVSSQFSTLPQCNMIVLAARLMGTLFSRQIVVSMHKKMVEEKLLISNFYKAMNQEMHWHFKRLNIRVSGDEVSISQCVPCICSHNSTCHLRNNFSFSNKKDIIKPWLNCHSLDNFESTTNTILCQIILHFRVMEILVKQSFLSSTKFNWLLKALMTDCQPQCTIYINLKWNI